MYSLVSIQLNGGRPQEKQGPIKTTEDFSVDAVDSLDFKYQRCLESRVENLSDKDVSMRRTRPHDSRTFRKAEKWMEKIYLLRNTYTYIYMYTHQLPQEAL